MAETRVGAGHATRFNVYKNKGRDLEDLRRRRAETSVELRKQKKEETLLKRRNVEVLNEEPTSPLKDHNMQQQFLLLPDIISGMASSDPGRVLQATESVRKILSRDKNPPVERILEAGLVQQMVAFLRCDDRPDLQFEAAWALTNIASGTSHQTQVVADAGAVPEFIRLLKSPSACLVEQCVWALGNIAGDGAQLRDFVSEHGIIEPLLSLVGMNAPLTLLRNVTWTISNLCRNKNPPPKTKVIKACLPTLRSLVHHMDSGILADACWALSYVTDGSNSQIQEVIELSDVVARLVELLIHPDPAVVMPALRTLGNIVTGNDLQTQVVLDCNVLQMLQLLLQHPKASIKKEACWALSNITAGSSDQIQAVINHNILPVVMEVLETGDFKSQKEAVWTITNMVLGGTLEQLDYLLQCRVLKPLCNLLTCKDAKVLYVILDGILNLLQAADRVGQADYLCFLLEEFEGLEKIENLQNHENGQVYNKAYEIIDRFFSEENNDKVIVPECNNDTNQFQFNVGNVMGQGFIF